MTLDLHKDGLILCQYGAGLSHSSLSASHPIARAAWEVTNDADVAENVRTASMMVKKVPGGDGDRLLRLYGSARPSKI